MKHITFLIIIFLFNFYAAAQDKNIQQTKSDVAVKKDLLLSSMQMNSRPEYNIKDRFLMTDSKEEKENSEKQQIENSIAQAEEFKLSTGLLYFAGAAAVAAIIYFLVPDNEPSSEKTYTFGLPVTPK